MIPDMPRPRPPNLHRETNRHGNVVWYVREGKGSRIRIKAEYGTPEFDAAYKAAINGERAIDTDCSLVMRTETFRD